MKILSIVNGVQARPNTDGSVCLADVNNLDDFHVFAFVHDLARNGELVHVFDYNTPHDVGLQTELSDWRPQQVVSFPISDDVFARFQQLTLDFAEMDKVGGLPFYYDRGGRYCADQGPKHITFDGMPYTPTHRFELTDITEDARSKENPFELKRVPMNCMNFLAFTLELSGAPLGMFRPKASIKERNTLRLTSVLRSLKDGELKPVGRTPALSSSLTDAANQAAAYLNVPTLSKRYEFSNPRALAKRGRHMMKHAGFFQSGDAFEGPQTMLPWYVFNAYTRVLRREPDATLFPRQGGKIDPAVLIPSQM